MKRERNETENEREEGNRLVFFFLITNSILEKFEYNIIQLNFYFPIRFGLKYKGDEDLDSI